MKAGTRLIKLDSLVLEEGEKAVRIYKHGNRIIVDMCFHDGSSQHCFTFGEFYNRIEAAVNYEE